MEIKITKDSHTINGDLLDSKVTKFGNGCHIPIAKEHFAKKVKVILPNDVRYFWVFGELELNSFIEMCEDKIGKKSNQLKHLRLEALENLKSNDFNSADITILVKLFDEKYSIIKKIKSVYLK